MMALTFDVVGAKASASSATPAVTFALRARTEEGCRVDLLALHLQIMISPRRRHYDDAEASALSDLFGEPSRWGETLRPLLWTHADAIFPGFDGETQIEVSVPCSYDFEVAANKYLGALEDGEIPLLLLFSGTVFLAGERGLQVERVPWNLEAPFRLPVSTYRAAMDAHFPNTAWIRTRRDVFDELNRFRSAGCYPSWERTFEALLEGARERR